MQVVDEGRGHVIIVQKTGLPDAVVWNPWADKARAMSDFGDEEYKVCTQYSDWCHGAKTVSMS